MEQSDLSLSLPLPLRLSLSLSLSPSLSLTDGGIDDSQIINDDILMNDEYDSG